MFDVVPENIAVIEVLPSASDVTSPLEPDVLLMVAIPVSEEIHVTNDDKSCVVLSENFPVAINCWVFPRAMVGFSGDTAIDTSTAGVTVSVAEEEGTESIVAAMVALPMSTAVANPFKPGVSPTVATVALDVVQVAKNVTSCVLQPPDNVPIAVNCWVVPLGIVVPTGDVTIDATADEVSVVESVFKS